MINRDMYMRFFTIYSLIIFSLISCSKENKTNEAQEALRFGAIYIGCESPPWQFNFSGILSCEQEEPAYLDLNPEHACAMLDIQQENGEIAVSFSDDSSLGRINIEANESVTLQDTDGNVVSSLYVNDEEAWFLTQNETRLELNIVNAYVGGCFHELIRWEEME